MTNNIHFSNQFPTNAINLSMAQRSIPRKRIKYKKLKPFQIGSKTIYAFSLAEAIQKNRSK